MLTREPGNRTLPTLITLLVVGLLLMTFDLRSQGEGITSTIRSGAQSILSPLQKAAAFAANPVVDMVDSLSGIASLREENIALRAALANAEAQLIQVQDDIARLELYEQLYDLESTGSAIGRTVVQVIGQGGTFDNSLIIDKGTSSGIAPGQPVIDTNGYVVGSVQQVTTSTAVVVPITVGASGVAVTVREETGTVVPQVTSEDMVLEVSGARGPVFAGDRVVTSSASVRFPAGYPVGEILEDASPVLENLTVPVRPFVNPETLRILVVLAWPPEPVSAAIEEPPAPSTTTTSTTTPASTSTTEGGG